MKKIFALCFMVFCFAASVDSCFALNIFQYKSKAPQNIEGTIKTTDNEDVITMPSRNKENFFRGMFMPTSLVTATAIAFVADPYVIPIDGVNYVMVKDKQTDDWSERDLLGIDDPKDNMFLSLRLLESDGDRTKLTPAELKKANIRLVRLADNDVLQVKDRSQDYSLDNIKYIDMKNIRRTANSEQTGIFGHFNVYLKTKDNSKKLAVGFVTFDTEHNLKILFE